MDNGQNAVEHERLRGEIVAIRSEIAEIKAWRERNLDPAVHENTLDIVRLQSDVAVIKETESSRRSDKRAFLAIAISVGKIAWDILKGHP